MLPVESVLFCLRSIVPYKRGKLGLPAQSSTMAMLVSRTCEWREFKINSNSTIPQSAWESGLCVCVCVRAWERERSMLDLEASGIRVSLVPQREEWHRQSTTDPGNALTLHCALNSVLLSGRLQSSAGQCRHRMCVLAPPGRCFLTFQ